MQKDCPKLKDISDIMEYFFMSVHSLPLGDFELNSNAFLTRY
jgi:hypothetical protein